jgi:N-acetylglucosaminyldiphosphoundecaprenol N-acetyl-beta-D-mannosaminyltransferase
VERRVILGVPVDPVTYGETLDRIAAFVSGDRLHQICTVNPEFVMTAQDDPAFMAILNQADLCIPDGVGLLWAARHLGTPLQERVAGSDLTWLIAERAAVEGWRLFLLGAREGVAARCADILSARYPGLEVIGTYPGSPRHEENAAIVGRVNAARPDILLVAYGAPAQDKWIARNRDALPTVRMAMGIGGAFDFVTGEAKRAPRWVQRLGLEWLDRLLREPWRWRRQLALPRFVWTVLQSRTNNQKE